MASFKFVTEKVEKLTINGMFIFSNLSFFAFFRHIGKRKSQSSRPSHYPPLERFLKKVPFNTYWPSSKGLDFPVMTGQGQSKWGKNR